jgi:aspartate aminotransferase-like enzyme
MDDKRMLMIPGPTPVPEQVLLAMAKHPIGHRSDEFSKMMAEITDHLRWLHQTQNDVLILASSGTGAMEAGIINFLSPGDRVVVGANGKFGDRWVKLAQVFGLRVEAITAPWGQALDPAAFHTCLTADTDKTIKAVIITHSETSTGVVNDLETISRHVQAHGKALMIVDGVTSVGACDVPVDAWGLDVVTSASQKGYMVPPGLGFVCVSPRAWHAYETATIPKFYLDLGPYRRDAAKHATPFTPPINLFYALLAALRMMQAEGLDAIFARHDRQKRTIRAAMKALGLPLYAPDAIASPAITAVAPTGVDIEHLRTVMNQRFDIVLAGGQDHLKGHIFRLGHLGFVGDRDSLVAVAALEGSLLAMGYTGFAPGAGVAAAAAVLAAG